MSEPRPEESGRLRQNFASAAGAFASVAQQVGPDRWADPGLGQWCIRDLVGHTSRSLLTIESYLAPGQTVADPDLPDTVAYYVAIRPALIDDAYVAERGRQAGAALGDDPVATIDDLADRVLRLVAASPDDAVITTPWGSIRLIDYLQTRTFELVVHTLDLVAALGLDAPAGLSVPMTSCLRLAADLADQRGDGAALLLALTGRRPLPDGFTVL